MPNERTPASTSLSRGETDRLVEVLVFLVGELDEAAALLQDQQGRDVGTPGTWFQVGMVEAEDEEESNS